MNRSIVFRIFLTLVLLGALAAVGFFAYNAGLVHGLAQNVQAAGGESVKSSYTYTYGMPFAHAHGFHTFGLLGCLGPLFLLFLFFGVMRALVWHGPHSWHRHGMGRWDWGEDGVPSRVQEWHRRMHGQEQEEREEKSEK